MARVFTRSAGLTRNSTAEPEARLPHYGSRSEGTLEVFEALLAEAERAAKLFASQSHADHAGPVASGSAEEQ